ncbi:MAG: hypothetical protein NBKEAIPA_01099 [Nitrospirae bacterium]|nr:MAG: hypothetical protein UZ03_NOB001002543 [Nitrospira sp. OLB3]MBV6469210.1 hypothetical protein [Nitrospirota bacterium]MCE7966843.1 hypothetical protein [Nitrospira sp. NTP2]MEB2337755.1 hypothetical protein [Nitrospirales bacterium]QOJ36924.1 MAG: hypothetical protein HRU82_19090 [Nitrospira sp.]
MRRVIVKIDQLALKGFRYEDRHAIAQGLQEQLALLFAEPGMAERLASLGDVPHLRTKAISIPGEASPRLTGTDVADGIGKGLMR